MCISIDMAHKRCPVCGVRGYQRIKWIATQLIGWCRHGHPYILEQEETRS